MDNSILNNVKEVKLGIMDTSQVSEMLEADLCTSFIYHDTNPVVIGSDFLIKVNTSVGISNSNQYDEEIKKINAISTVKYAPDLIMDHTMKLDIDKPIWRFIADEIPIPVGTVPVYSVFDEEKGIDLSELLDCIEEMAEGGVRFMTFHPTATLENFTIAKKSRQLPMTSWGGGDVLKDMIINNRTENIISANFLNILQLLKKYNVTISIGSVFRPGGIDDALDEAHILETYAQKKYIDIAKSYGVHVIMEGIGHIDVASISKYIEIIRPYKTPLMPLGPMPTDASIGFDHVAGALGAFEAARNGVVGIINSVTRAEHLGGIPSTDDVVEGLKCATTLAHIINLNRFDAIRNIDRQIYSNRSSKKTCIVNGGLFEDVNDGENRSCDRCDIQCPLRTV